jgi:hypothetical protein
MWLHGLIGMGEYLGTNVQFSFQNFSNFFFFSINTFVLEKLPFLKTYTWARPNLPKVFEIIFK